MADPGTGTDGPSERPSDGPPEEPPDARPGAAAHRPEDGELRRTLGFRDLVVYGLLFIAPMAPVGVFGTLDAKSHGAVALVYVVATVAMAFTAFSYAQMVRVAPRPAPSSRTRARGSAKGPDSSPAGWRCSTIC